MAKLFVNKNPAQQEIYAYDIIVTNASESVRLLLNLIFLRFKKKRLTIKKSNQKIVWKI